MLRKIAAFSMLALCSFASGCWFNSPCCSPYDKCGPTFGDDPSIPCDFNYRKGSILGSETPSGEYFEGGTEYVPDDGMVSEQFDEQTQPVAQQPRRLPGMTRTATPMNQGARYPGMANRGGGYQRGNYQGNTYQGNTYQGGNYEETDYQDGNQDAGYQAAGPNRGGSNPMYQARRSGRVEYQNDGQ